MDASERDRQWRELVEPLIPDMRRQAESCYGEYWEDVVQNTLMSVWRSLPLSHVQNIKGYLFRSMRNHSLNVPRSTAGKLARVTMELEEFDDHSLGIGDAERDLVEMGLSDRSTAALGALSDFHRTLLILRDIEGMRYAEISEYLSLPIGTMRSGLFRAREHFKIAYEGRPVPKVFPRGERHQGSQRMSQRMEKWLRHQALVLHVQQGHTAA